MGLLTRSVGLIAVLCATLYLKASFRSNAVQSGFGAGLHTPPGQYSPLRRWLHDEENEVSVVSPENRTNCNFTINFNTSEVDFVAPSGSEEAGAPSYDAYEAAVLYYEELDMEMVNFTNGTFPCDAIFEPMPIWEMVLWLLLLLYLFLALYIICDHHFVPALEVRATTQS